MPSSGCQTCARSEEHTSELQSHDNLVCRLLLEKKKMICIGTLPFRVASHVHPEHRPDGFVSTAPTQCQHRRGGGRSRRIKSVIFFFFNDTATTEIYTLSLHDALPISARKSSTIARAFRSAASRLSWAWM